jgi:hypothetical protein
MASDEWPECPANGCRGAGLIVRQRCLAHLTPTDRDEYLRSGTEVDGRGVKFTKELIHELIATSPPDDEPARTARFDEASFPDDAAFGGARFGDGTSFTDAVFGDRAYFRDASFGKSVSFSGVIFGEEPNFRAARFGDRASFYKAEFGRRSRFRDTVFGSNTSFDGTKVGDYANFRQTTFGAGTIFSHATFGRAARFNTSRFGDGAHFVSVTFGDDLTFEKVLFEGRVHLDEATFGAKARLNVFCRGSANLSLTGFGPLADIHFAGKTLNLRGADFSEGGSLRAWGTDVDLTRAKFGAPFLLTERAPLSRSGPEPDPDGFSTTNASPRLVSVDEADVRNLVVDQVELGECRFGQAHNLDELRVGSSDQFLLPDKTRALTRRRVVYEDFLWRRTYESPSRWTSAAVPTETKEPGDPRGEARQVERIYRSLRKGFEDHKNTPGSADFYYGEMDMRRLGSESRTERALLFGYWLLAGYGLRAWRALVALAIAIILGTVVFGLVGFTARSTVAYVPTSAGGYVQRDVPGPLPGWSDAFSYTVQSSMSLVRPASALPLTDAGRYTELVLRVLCPLLLGLALLSIRARVKR